MKGKIILGALAVIVAASALSIGCKREATTETTTPPAGQEAPATQPAPAPEGAQPEGTGQPGQ